MATTDDRGMITGVGRARKAVLATLSPGGSIYWEEAEVKWDETHEQEREGYHHATIARFLQDRQVRELWARGAGPEMRRMLERLHVNLHIAEGAAQDVITAEVRGSTNGSSAP